MGENAGRLGSLSLVLPVPFLFAVRAFARSQIRGFFILLDPADSSRKIHRTKFRLIEFAARRGLLGAHAAGDDFRLRVIFAANRSAGQAAQHRQLADVR